MLVSLGMERTLEKQPLRLHWGQQGHRVGEAVGPRTGVGVSRVLTQPPSPVCLDHGVSGRKPRTVLGSIWDKAKGSWSVWIRGAESPSVPERTESSEKNGSGLCTA